MSARKDKSDIWKYFKKKAGDEKRAVCKYCFCELSRGGKNATSKGFTTSALWSHVRRFHPQELDKISTTETNDDTEAEDSAPVKKIKKQISLTDLLEKKTRYDCNDPRAIKITYLIAELIAVDIEPLDIVNKQGFRRLLNELAPRYDIVSRAHLTEKVLPDIYDRVKQKIKREKLNSIPFLSLTTDLWTSDNSSHVNDFISITVHGVNDEFYLKAYCLEVCPFEGTSHSGQNIANNLSKIILEWELTNKIQAIVTDNARNMLRSITVLQLDMGHIPCSVHTIQLVLKSGLFSQDHIVELLSTCRKIVTHFNHSTFALKQLRVSQEANNLPQHVLFQDVETRWDSTHQMLKRLYEQRMAIQHVLPSLPSCHHEITARQWGLINQIIEVLVNFEDATKELSKENTTLSGVIPILKGLQSCLKKIKDNESTQSDVKDMVTNLLGEFSKKFYDIEQKNYIMATALDPRFKLRIFESSAVKDMARSFLYSALNESNNEQTQSRQQEPQASTSRGIWQACQEIIEQNEMDEPVSVFSDNSQQRNEVDCYLRLPNLSPCADPLAYWRENKHFPKLKKLAQMFFSIKASTVDSERLFSTAGKVQTEDRNRLAPRNLQMLTFLKKNLPIVDFNY